MAELTPATAPAASEPEVYRPLSLAAVGGFSMSVLCAGLVVLTTVVALLKGAPLFLANWLVTALAASGVLLSWIGILAVRYSEGTRAGAALARYGIWLSVVPGLGYLAYSFFTGLALTQQANDFLTRIRDDDSGFWQRLTDAARLQSEAELSHGEDRDLKLAQSQASVDSAFLLTLPYVRRAGHLPAPDVQRAQDIPKFRDWEARLAKDFDIPSPMSDVGEIGLFREHKLVRAILMSGKDVTIESLGVQDWEYEQGSYTVRRNYRITTPEFIFEVLVPVGSTEGEESEGKRKWFVIFTRQQLNRPTKSTPLGDAVEKARGLSRTALKEWLDKSKREPVTDLTNYEHVVPKPLVVEVFKKRTFAIFEGKDTEFRGHRTLVEDFPATYQRLLDGRARFTHDFNVVVEPTRETPVLRIRAQVAIETRDAYDPLTASAAPTWAVKSFLVVRLGIVAPPPLKK